MQHCRKVRFVNFLSSGFITAIVVNSPETKLAKHTSVRCLLPDLNLKRFKAVKNILRYENSYVLNHSLGDQDSIWSSFINTIIYSFPLHGEKNTTFFWIWTDFFLSTESTVVDLWFLIKLKYLTSVSKKNLDKPR